MLGFLQAGLQQRLKEQEGNLSGLKSELMKLELEKEKLILESVSFNKRVIIVIVTIIISIIIIFFYLSGAASLMLLQLMW